MTVGLLALAVASCRTAPVEHEAPMPIDPPRRAEQEVHVPAESPLKYIEFRDLPPIEPDVGQDVCFLGFTVLQGGSRARFYRASCGGVAHASNPVFIELWDILRAEAEGTVVHAVIGVSGDDIRSIRWWVDDP